MHNTRTVRMLLTILMAILAGSSIGQSVHIVVKDSEKTLLVGATVQLISLDDSAKLFRVTDQNGIARFENVRQGLFGVSISYVGFQTIEKTILVKNGHQSHEYQMAADIISLGEITITARRPLIRQEDDKMIIDPEPIASISTNTLEILESTPGLFIDPDGGIYLNSASPATIFINGREQKMSNQDIMTVLRNLPPGSVQHIEVIRTPSARFSASASGGIINIVLKKGMKIGRFGSINSGMNQGVYGNRFLGVNFNNGGERSSSYLNLNYSNNNMLEELSSSRLLQPNTTLYQSAETRRKAHQAYVGYGINYDINDRLLLSYDGRTNASMPHSSSNNNNLIRDFDEFSIISETDNIISNKSEFLSLSQDVGITYKLDTIGSEWDTKFSYSYNLNDVSQHYQTVFVFPFTTQIPGEGDNKQRRHFFQFQSDVTYQLPLKIKLETGMNSAYQEYKSNSEFNLTINGQQTNDPSRTNAFSYRERINAGYLQFSRPLPGEFLLKAGLRMEHTYMAGNQTIPADTSFLINRADWFPYLYLSRPIAKVQNFELRSYLIYRKTISRPGYQSLNPYINYIDQFLYETGNPALRPQFADNFEVNISVDDMPIFAFGQTYTRDIFSSVIYQDANLENVAVRTHDNLGKNKETYFRAIGAIPPGSKYFFVAGAQYNLNVYEGVYENQPLSYRRGSWRFFTFHSLRLAKEMRLTMSGFMMTNGQFNFYELKTFGQLNLGLNQTFLNKKLTVTLNARDVLRTMTNDFTLNQGSIITSGSRYSDNQRIGINIRYNFGIPDRQEKQNIMRIDLEE